MRTAVRGGGLAPYCRACDLHLVAIGDKTSVHCVTKKSYNAAHAQFLDSVSKKPSTLGIICATNTSLTSKRKSIVSALHIIYRYAYHNDTIYFGESVRESLSKVDNQIFCVLHVDKRVIEKVISLLFTWYADELKKEERKIRVQHIYYLSLFVNSLAWGSEAKPGHWKCPVKNESKVRDCSFTYVQANNVELKLPEIIDGALKLHASRPRGWKDAVLKITKIMTTLRQRVDFSDEQIKAFELELNAWTDEWISIVG
jgi:hypothetical protein